MTESDAPPPYILKELDNITRVLYRPIVNSRRIKYTCFNVSRNLIVLGATSGGIYIFNRNPLEFTQLIPNKEGIVMMLAISLDEKFISYANSYGIVNVIECNHMSNSPRMGLLSEEHKGNEVTAMQWSLEPMVYIGDNMGKISILQLPKLMTSMFHNNSQVIMILDSRICQIDLHDNMLVVSTLTRCYISDIEREQYRQVGQKLRDGEFGVCFVTDNKEFDEAKVKAKTEIEREKIKQFQVASADDFCRTGELARTKIYCARPSSRLWQASVFGTVEKTLQYKQILANKPRQVLVKNDEYVISGTYGETDGQSVNFSKLHALKHGVIFTYTKDNIYFLNIDDIKHTMWFENYTNIVDCKVIENNIYIWHLGGTITSLEFFKIEHYIEEQPFAGKERFLLYDNTYMKSELNRVKEVLNPDGDELNETLDLIMEKLSWNSITTYKMDENTEKSQYFFNNYEKYSKCSELEPVIALKNNSSNEATSVDAKLANPKAQNKNIDVDELEIKRETMMNGNREFFSDNIITDQIKGNNKERQIGYNCNFKRFISPVKPVRRKKFDLCRNLFNKLYVMKMHCMNKKIISHLPEAYDNVENFWFIITSLRDFLPKENFSPEVINFLESVIFLNYIKWHRNQNKTFETIVHIENILIYFFHSIIIVNQYTKKDVFMGCKCGYPLPNRKPRKPLLFEYLVVKAFKHLFLINLPDACHRLSLRVPEMWTSFYYLQAENENFDPQLLMQLWNEDLFCKYMGKFDKETWNLVFENFNRLMRKQCLYCNETFDSVDFDHINWERFACLILVTLGAPSMFTILQENQQYLAAGDLSLGFYHSVYVSEKYRLSFDDEMAIFPHQLFDSVYWAYKYDDGRAEVLNLIKQIKSEKILNMSMPLKIAAKSDFFNLPPLKKIATELEILEHIFNNKSDKSPLQCADCALCGIYLGGTVFIENGGIRAFCCGHIFHGACLKMLKIKSCTICAIHKV